jgi:2'-5' RNA ligase
VRVLDPELAHLTLCFLGDRPIEQITAIGVILERCAEPVGELSVGAPLWLPARRPRVLAVELHEDRHGGLDRLYRALRAELGKLCELERRRFRAHVTVARMRAAQPPRERTLPPTPALSFNAQTLVLYRSWLSPRGPSYEPLARVRLM